MSKEAVCVLCVCGQSLCTLRTGSALALALFLTSTINAGCVPNGRTWLLSRAALWQPEWVFWLLVFGSNGNGPIPHVVAEQGCLNSWQPEWVFWLLVFDSNGKSVLARH